MNQCLFTAPATYVIIYWFILQPILLAFGFGLGWYSHKKEAKYLKE